MPVPLPPQTPTRPSPTLETVHKIERILREAARRGEPPLSFAEIERRLPTKKIRRATTKAAIGELRRFSLVAVGSKGVLWVVPSDDAVLGRPRYALL